MPMIQPCKPLTSIECFGYISRVYDCLHSVSCANLDTPESFPDNAIPFNLERQEHGMNKGNELLPSAYAEPTTTILISP
jgi:hypothetical protein